MPALRSSGDISLTSSLLGEFAFPRLEKTGNFYLINNTRLKRVTLPELSQALDLQLYGNTELEELAAPKLSSLTTLIIQSNPLLRRVSLPLASPTSKVELSTLPFLTSLELPAVQSLAGWLTISNCLMLERARLPGLTNVEQVQLDRLPKLTELDLSSLRQVPSGGQLNELGTDPGFPVSLPELQSAGPFTVAAANVSAFSAPKATRLDSLTLHSLPSLRSLDLRKLEAIDALYISATQLPDLLTLTKPPVGVGALASATTVTIAGNASLPVCAVTELESSLGAGLSGVLSQSSNIECPCNGASCQ